jgi:S1-C subfamily serine protease
MIVVAVAGEPVTGADDFVRLLDGERIGIPTGLSVVADGKLRTIIIVPDERDQH